MEYHSFAAECSRASVCSPFIPRPYTLPLRCLLAQVVYLPVLGVCMLIARAVEALGAWRELEPISHGLSEELLHCTVHART